MKRLVSAAVLVLILAAAAVAQDKPPPPLTPAQRAQEKSIRAGLPGAWVIPADGACNSGAPWIFTARGEFRTERVSGHWRLDGRRIFLAGYDWDLDNRHKQRVVGVWAATWTVLNMTRTRMTMRRKSDGKRFTFNRCR
jgi:opacity protein-like surface antigen